MELIKSFSNDIIYKSEGFEKDLCDNKIDFKKIEDVQVYKFRIGGGTKYNFYDYNKNNGQRTLVCVTYIGYGDESAEEGIIFYLDNDEIYDIEDVCEQIRNYNELIEKRIFNNYYTFSEASEKWGLGESTLRSTVKTARLVEGIDYRKSGKVWLITQKAMYRVYGESLKINKNKVNEN